MCLGTIALSPLLFNGGLDTSYQHPKRARITVQNYEITVTGNNPQPPSIGLRTPLASGKSQSRALLHAGQPIFRSHRTADAFGLSQGCIGHRFVKRLSQEGGEVADPLQCRRDVDMLVALPGNMRPRTGPTPVLGAIDQPGPDWIERDIAQRRDQICASSIATELKRPCHRCPVTRMRALMKPV